MKYYQFFFIISLLSYISAKLSIYNVSILTFSFLSIITAIIGIITMIGEEE